MGKLEGKIALITGGNSGIGLATAQQFVHEGAYVFITGRRMPELAAAVQEIGSNITGVQGDVSNLGDLDRLFAQIKCRPCPAAGHGIHHGSPALHGLVPSAWNVPDKRFWTKGSVLCGDCNS
jgi:NAD(P)-dependent dehydrogenase (short-subunit alcohol dehydrogenase family)